MTQPQQQAFWELQSAYGTAQPYINSALNYANSAASPSTITGNISTFSDPYTQQVINASLAQANQQNQIQQNQLQGSAAAQGALGGDRLGVAQGVLGGQQALANNSLIAGLNQANYSQALNAAQQNAAAQGQAAYTLGNLGQEALNTGITGAQAGLSAGNQLQAQQQALNNAATQNAQAQTMWPYQNEQFLASQLAALGPLLGGSSTGQTTTPAPNPLGMIIGGGLAGYSLFSDKRVKEDIKPIGKTFDNQTIYQYRYKGDPATRIGLIAQDVEKKHPDAVQNINGIKAVDYGKATDAAADKGHFKSGGAVILPFRKHRDMGGGVDNMMSMPYGYNMGTLPAARINFPSLPQLPQQNNQNNILGQVQQMQSFANLGKNVNNSANANSGSSGGLLSKLNNQLGDPFGINTPSVGSGMDPLSGGLSGGVGDLDFSKGGSVRRHFDDGGSVDGDISPFIGSESHDSDLSPYVPSNSGQSPFSDAELSNIVNQNTGPSFTPYDIARSIPLRPISTDPGVTDNSAASNLSPQPYQSPTGLSPNGIAFLKNQEGFSAKPYSDYKQTSIGYGTKASPGESSIDEAEAERRMVSEAQPVSDWLKKNVKVPLTQGQMDALTSFGYNTGVGNLANLRDDINKGDWSTVADRMQKYVMAGGQPLQALKDRRQQEANMLLGKYEPGSSISPNIADVVNSHPQVKNGILSSLGLTDSTGSAPTQQGKGLLSSLGLPDFNPLGLNDTQRNALLTAGLAMMGNPSPFAAVQIGQGGLQGMSTYLSEQQQDRAAAAKARELAQTALYHQQEIANTAQQRKETLRHNLVEEGKPIVTGENIDQFGISHKQYTTPMFDPQTQRYVYPPTNQVSVQNPTTNQSSSQALPNPNELTGDGYLQSLEKQGPQGKFLASYVRDIAQGRRDIPSLSSRNPISIAVNQVLEQAYPNVDKNAYGTLRGILQDETKGNTRANITSINTAIGHADELMDRANALNNFSIPFGNAPINWVNRQVSDDYQARQKDFDRQAQLTAEEFARAVKGGTPSLAEVEEMKDVLSHNMTPAALSKVINGMVEAMNPRIEAIQHQHELGYKLAGQEPKPLDILTDKNKKILQKLKSIQNGESENTQSKDLTKIPRPSGKSDDQLKAEAQDAIKAGKDPKSVMQQLQTWGIQ